jgi:undecaprenyl-phosphate 4-deoxy-4-formamido-L-arabinose transferase
MAKWISMKLLGNEQGGEFNSFRLIDGEVGRGLAAFCGNGIYLDMALSWVVAQVAHCPVLLRAEGDRYSAYSYRKLISHFWRMVLTSGTRPLRFVSLIGLVSILLGSVLIVYAVWGKLTGRVPIPGWTSTVVVVSLFSGFIMFSLGIVAEYLGVMLTMALGKPLYIIVSRPCRSVPARR